MSDGFLNDLGLDNVEADPNYIADGKYDAYVFSSEVKVKKDGSPSWVLTYKLTAENPRHGGQTQTEWFDLKPTGEKAEIKKSFLKRRVLSLGVPESKIGELNPADVIGTHVAITIVHRNGYQNIGTVENLEGVSSASSAPSADLF